MQTQTNQLYVVLPLGVGMSPENEVLSPSLGFSSIRDDLTLSCGDLDSSHEPGRRSRTRSSLQTRTPEVDMSW